MDSETLKVNQEGRMLDDFVKSEGWTWIKDRLKEEIMDLQSIRNISESQSPEEVVLDIKARNTAIETLLKIIQKVEGRAAQHSNNNQPTYVHEEIIVIQD